MPTQTFNLNYNVNTSLLFSAEELRVNYLVDIPMKGLGGEGISPEVQEKKIKIAQEQIGGLINMILPLTRLAETQDWQREHFNKWGYIQLNYPINGLADLGIKSLGGYINLFKQLVYPTAWLSFERDEYKQAQSRNMYIVPGQQLAEGTGDSFQVIFSDDAYFMSIANTGYIPNYWRVDYITGFSDIPVDVLDAVGKLATIAILAILGDITFGAGIASKSISIDGLSQSIGTTQSAENSLYSARIRQLTKELVVDLKGLKRKYKGLTIRSL